MAPRNAKISWFIDFASFMFPKAFLLASVRHSEYLENSTLDLGVRFSVNCAIEEYNELY